MNETELKVEKYVQGLASINSTLGRLDVLRLHLKNDRLAITIIDNIIEDLSNTLGVKYKKIDNSLFINSIDVKENKSEEKIEIKNIKETTIEPAIVHIVEKPEKKNNIATAITSIRNRNKVYTNKEFSKGVEIDDNNRYTYKFINSNTLNYMIYNRDDKELIMSFKNNGRTYKYYNVAIYIFDNLVGLDENGASAGAYFQQNIVKKWTSKNYEEITDSMVIG